MSSVPLLFPAAVLGAMLIVTLLAVRLDRRLSRGTGSAGDLDPTESEPVGQARTPWEVKAIDAQIRFSSAPSVAIPRYDLAVTVNRLIKSAGLPTQYLVPPDATPAQLEQAVTVIEQQLDLPPLGSS